MEKITASECECGQMMLPPKERCIICSGPTRPVEIDNTGKLLTYTVLQVTPEGFDPPLILGLVRLDGGPKLVGEGKLPEDKLRRA